MFSPSQPHVSIGFVSFCSFIILPIALCTFWTRISLLAFLSTLSVMLKVRCILTIAIHVAVMSSTIEKPKTFLILIIYKIKLYFSIILIYEIKMTCFLIFLL